MDTVTGILLAGWPGWVVGLMAVPEVPAVALIFLRWIGVFVGGVGACYLLALVRGGSERLRDVLGFTAVIRFGVGAFVTMAMAEGALELQWWPVAVTDLGLAGVQAWWLAKGAWRDE